MYFKDFDGWNIVKKRIHQEERKIFVRAGEIRWASMGVNVGSEIDGKGVSFTRPVLIVNVSGPSIALVIPLSTKIKKDVAGYVEFTWKGEKVSLCIHQTRVISQKRLLHRLGKVSPTKLKKAKDNVKAFFAL